VEYIFITATTKPKVCSVDSLVYWDPENIYFIGVYFSNFVRKVNFLKTLRNTSETAGLTLIVPTRTLSYV